MSVIGIVASAAGGVEHLRAGLVEPLVAFGHTVPVTLTPTAARWLEHLSEIGKLEAVTGLPVRAEGRLPGEPRPHPKADAYVVVPASANTVAKLALGIGDNQALSVLCESVGSVPMLVFPRVNAAHARHPSWQSHIDVLRGAGVRLLYGEDVWPLREPREEDGRPIPWEAILSAIEQLR
jgi:phosphopantothenoylcysteine synthetase/decarboxylase